MKVRKRRSHSGTACLLQLGELLRRQHARHQHVVLDAVHLHPVGGCVCRRHELAAVAQPVAHELDFIALCDDHSLAEHLDIRPRRACRRPAAHEHGLRMVRDHTGHEVHIRLAVGLPYQLGACLGFRGTGRRLLVLSPVEGGGRLTVSQRANRTNRRDGEQPGCHDSPKSGCHSVVTREDPNA